MLTLMTGGGRSGEEGRASVAGGGALVVARSCGVGSSLPLLPLLLFLSASAAACWGLREATSEPAVVPRGTRAMSPGGQTRTRTSSGAERREGGAEEEGELLLLPLFPPAAPPPSTSFVHWSMALRSLILSPAAEREEVEEEEAFCRRREGAATAAAPTASEPALLD